MSNPPPPPPPPGWEPPRGQPPSQPPPGSGWPGYGGPPPPYGPPPPRPRRTGLIIAIVLGLLVALVFGASLVAAAFFVYGDSGGAAGDDPTRTETTAEPTDEPTPEPTEETGGPDVLDDPEPTETTAPPATSRERLKADDYREDWNFRLGDKKAFAAFKQAWDHRTCAPVEKGGALTGRGCRYAVEATYLTRDGRLQVTNVFLGMKDDMAARRTERKLKAAHFRVQPASTLPGVRDGHWRATAQAEIVVLTLVTAESGVPDERVNHYLHYANSDFSSALLFR